MSELRLLSRRQRSACAAVSLVAALCVLGSVLLVFADDGRTPWFRADSQMAAQLLRCGAERSSSERHRCLREVAVAADARSTPAVALAPK